LASEHKNVRHAKPAQPQGWFKSKTERWRKSLFPSTVNDVAQPGETHFASGYLPRSARAGVNQKFSATRTNSRTRNYSYSSEILRIDGRRTVMAVSQSKMYILFETRYIAARLRAQAAVHRSRMAIEASDKMNAKVDHLVRGLSNGILFVAHRLANGGVTNPTGAIDLQFPKADS